MRKILLAFFLVGIVASSQAQFGVRAGFNSPSFSPGNSESNPGVHLGAYYTIGTEFISVEPGLQFSQKGFKDNSSGDLITERLNYIDIPVLVRLNLLPSVNVFAGPQASALISRKRESLGETQTSTDPVRGYDIGGVLGAQVKLPLGLNAQASYDFGLTSLNYYNLDVKNQVFKIGIGYTFGGNSED